MKLRHRAGREDQIQRACFQHLAWRGVPGLFAFHPANGGWRSPIEARILKGLGVIAGVPDIIIIHATKVYALELKADDGRITMRSSPATSGSALPVRGWGWPSASTAPCASSTSGGYCVPTACT
jgi:hypothetical protein